MTMKLTLFAAFATGLFAVSCAGDALAKSKRAARGRHWIDALAQ
jgi:hypothetical protein